MGVYAAEMKQFMRTTWDDLNMPARMNTLAVAGLKVPVNEYADRVEIDTQLLAERIAYLLEHPDEAGKKAQNGRKRCLKEIPERVFIGSVPKQYDGILQINIINEN